MPRASLPRRRTGLALAVALCAALPLAASDKGATYKPGFTKDASAAEARLLKDISYLAGDECEGRGITTKGIQLAADHIAGVMKDYGLKPGGTDGYFQPFEVARGGASLGSGNAFSLKGTAGQTAVFKLGDQFVTLAAGANGTVSAPVVFAGYGAASAEPAYDDFAGLDCEGKVVIVLRKLPRAGNAQAQPNFPANSALAGVGAKVAAAQAKKAAAVLIVNDKASAGDTDSLVAFSYPLSGTTEKVTIPVMMVRRSVVNQMLKTAGKDLTQIEQAIDRDFKPQSFAIDGWTADLTTNATRAGVKCKNVIGVVEGAGPLADETVVIGAHYDHLGFGGSGSLAGPRVTAIHYGADDNASGTVAVLELARRFSKMEGRQGRRLVFMLYSAEESGLLGSAHYCKAPTFPLEKTVAMVNLDMVGRYREEEKLQVMGVTTAKDKLFDKMVEKANESLKLKLALSGGGAFFGASDHYSFYLKNVPVVFFFTGMHPQYHRPLDQVPTINIQGIRQVCDLAESLISQLAEVDPKPEFVKLTSSSSGGGAAATPRMRGPTLGINMNYGREKPGVELTSVTEGRLAAKAGLKAGDVIVEISGKPVKDVQGYMAIMNGFKRGDEIEVVFERKDEKQKVKIKLVEEAK